MAAPTNAPKRPAPPAKGTKPPAGGPLQFTWVTFKAPKNVEINRPKIEMPEGWGEDQPDVEESARGIHPTANWQKPGEGLIGAFVSWRDQTGPNKQRVYTFRVDPEEGDAQLVSVWGTTILDTRMDNFNPAINHGDQVMILYLGDVTTKRGLSDAKDFIVQLKRTG